MRCKQWLTGLMLVGLCGCSGMNHTETGALAGGGIGALFGALIGGATGHAGAGALIGGAGGALVGGAVGHDQDRTEAHARAAAEYAARNPPLPLNEVVQMSQQRISDETILRHMDATRSFYQLTTADISYLRDHGVSDQVINAMISRRPGPVMVHPRHVVIVEQPPPPVAVGIGFHSHIR